MVRSVAGNLPEQVKNNQSVNTAAGNGGQKMSQYSWFTVYCPTLDNCNINYKECIRNQFDFYTLLFNRIKKVMIQINHILVYAKTSLLEIPFPLILQYY